MITLFERLERNPGRVFASIGCLFAIVYLSALTLFPHGRGTVDGDTIQYYAYLRSLVIDHDLDFTNDYQLLYTPTSAASGNVWLRSKTPIGRATNLMSIGPAILWAPAFLATYAVLAALRLVGVSIPLDGIAAPFPLSVGVAGVFYATLGAFLCYRTCRLLVPERAAFWSALVAWLATSAVYYSLVSPAYSHATSLFASALFCYVWLKHRDNPSVGHAAWLGIFAGIAALVRWQDAVILILPLFDLVRALTKGEAPARSLALRAGVMIVVTACMLLPQLVAWKAIYGQYVVMPQGEGFMQWSKPALLSVLFSLRHGLFSWTPAALVAAIGLGYLVRREATVGVPVMVVMVLAIYVNASVSDWWAGEAFGARRFVGDTVLFALGLGALFGLRWWQNRPGLLRWTAVVLITYNLLFLLQYQLVMRGFHQFGPYPTTFKQVFFDRLTVPWHLFAAWL